MSDRPILFSAPMVRALLDGRKTQTRRVLKPQPVERPGMNCRNLTWYDNRGRLRGMDSPEGPFPWTFTLYAPSDRLYVREPWRVTKSLDDVAPRDLDRTTMPEWLATDPELYEGRKRPGMHLPRWASRITLTVTDVRVQRLQEISNSDCLAEGIDPEEVDRRGMSEARLLFRELWDGINAARGYGWDANPWVAAISFTVEHRNIDQVRS